MILRYFKKYKIKNPYKIRVYILNGRENRKIFIPSKNF